MPRWSRRGRSGASASTPSPDGSAPALSSLPPTSPRPSPSTGGRGATPEEQRFAQVYAADRVGPMPYPNQAVPDVGAARTRVRSLVHELLDGLDEGTGAALDPLIASWTSGWLSRVDSQHADHQAVIDRLVGGARQQLAEAEATHERDRRALEIARRDYTEARERLLEPVARSTTEPARERRTREEPTARPDTPAHPDPATRPEPTTRQDPPRSPPAEPATGPVPVRRR